MSPNLRWLLSSVDMRSVTDCNPNYQSGAHAVVSQTKSIKIIKDRDDRPKGFGYIEFSTLDGLKDALARSGQNFASRIIRISVAEPRKSVLDQLTEAETQSREHSQRTHRWRLRRRCQVRCPMEARWTTPRLEGFTRFFPAAIRRRQATTPFNRPG